MPRRVALRAGWVLLALSSIGLLAAPAAILRHLPPLATRTGRHTLAGLLALVCVALLQFVLAVVPIRKGERWAIAAATIPFLAIGVPILFVDAFQVAPDRVWRTIAPQIAGLASGAAALGLCAYGTRS